jgi:hypothetical protein
MIDFEQNREIEIDLQIITMTTIVGASSKAYRKAQLGPTI